MGIYQSGQGVKIEETVKVSGVPTNATTATYKIWFPDGTLVSYVFGVDVEVTNPATGVYDLDPAPNAAPGLYQYQLVTTGTAAGASEIKTYTILSGGSLAPEGMGPCSNWVDSADVLACCSAEIGSDTTYLEMSVAAAVELLYEASSRRFPGICQRTVRPCRLGTCRWGEPQVLSRGHLVGWDGSRWDGFDCGCRPTSRVKLAGRAHQIVQVKIDGIVLDPTEYALQDGRWLIRESPNRWPSCQDISLPDTEDGTWSVTYTYGKAPPMAGQLAAQALACEILKGCNPDAECAIPKGAMRVTRQGITLERNFFIRQRAGARSGKGTQGVFWATGITEVDFFLNTFNPAGIPRRATFWSASSRNRYAKSDPS